MARLILLLALVALATAAVLAAIGMVVTATRGLPRAGAVLAGRDGMRNLVYVALLVLLLGVTSGLLGGL